MLNHIKAYSNELHYFIELYPHEIKLLGATYDRSTEYLSNMFWVEIIMKKLS
jgi:hypothetical protein